MMARVPDLTRIRSHRVDACIDARAFIRLSEKYI